MNIFIKQAAPWWLKALPTLVGGVTGAGIGAGVNTTMPEATPMEQAFRIGSSGMTAAAAMSPWGKTALRNAYTKPGRQLLQRTPRRGLLGKMKAFDHKSIAPDYSPGALRFAPVKGTLVGSAALAAPLTWPVVPDYINSWRRNMNRVTDDYVESDHDSFLKYWMTNMGEGVAEIKGVRDFVTATAEKSKAQLAEYGKEYSKKVLTDLKEKTLPLTVEMGKEMGKGFVPVGTGFGVGGAAGYSIASLLTKPVKDRDTGKGERAYQRRNQIKNIAALVGSTLGAGLGYADYQASQGNVVGDFFKSKV